MDGETEREPPAGGESPDDEGAVGSGEATPRALAAIAATEAGRRREPRRLSRRSVLRIGFWAGLGASVAGTLGMTADLFYPRGVTGFGATVVAGNVQDFLPGTKTQVTQGRFWLVHLTEEQGGPGLLALWWKCPHLGCTVPWREDFVWPEPDTGRDKSGWFRCPCHGSTFTDAGVRVFGPAPRGMDVMALKVENGRVIVDTGSISHGGPDNASRAVRV